MSTSSIGTRVDNLEASRTKMRTTIKAQGLRIEALEEALEALQARMDVFETPVVQEQAPQAPPVLVQAPVTEKKAKPVRTTTSITTLFILLALVFGVVFGAWVVYEKPTAYVGKSESGARIVLHPVSTDEADTVGTLWPKDGSVTTDENGTPRELEVQNWVPVQKAQSRTPRQRAAKSNPDMPAWLDSLANK